MVCGRLYVTGYGWPSLESYQSAENPRACLTSALLRNAFRIGRSKKEKWGEKSSKVKSGKNRKDKIMGFS